jgi:hypothetical protein
MEARFKRPVSPKKSERVCLPVVTLGHCRTLSLFYRWGQIKGGSAGAVTAVPSQEASEAGPVPRADSGQAAAFGLIANVRGRIWGYSVGVHNTVVASYSQMCVRNRPSTRDHSALLRGQFAIRSGGASIRESTGQNSLAEACRKRQEQRSRESSCRSTSYRRFVNQDMRVSKPLCSRCALNVSFWAFYGIPCRTLTPATY